MTSDLRKYIESKSPCREYKQYVSDKTITNNSTLRNILMSNYILVWDKEWLVGQIFSDLGASRFYGLLRIWTEEFFIIRNYDEGEVHYELEDVIPFLEEVLYYILYEKDEEED